MIIRELSKKEARAELRAHGLSERGLPYRGYAVTLSDDGKRRRFIGHAPDGRYLLQENNSEIQEPLYGEAVGGWSNE